MEFNKPTPFGTIKTIDGIVNYIVAEPDKYRKGKSIKKNLTIPEWLSSEAEKAGVNFSAVLQEALRHKLGV